MSRRLAGLVVVALITALLPLATASPAAALVAGDTFNSPTLDDDLWDEAGNSLGGAIFQYTGAQAALSVPPGSASYQPWTSGNRAPTLRQDVTDSDFDVVAAFGTQPSKKFQLQGIVVADAAGNFLRFDVHWDGEAMRAFAAMPLESSANLINVQVPNASHAAFVRVTRTGDLFELLTSPNAIAWTSHGSFERELTVSQIGPFVGNAKPSGGSAPAYSGLIDYFGPLPIPGNALGPADDNTTPGFDDIDIVRAPNFITVNWAGDEPVTATGTLSGAFTQNSPDPFPRHEVHFTGLTPGTTYSLSFQVTDLNGKTAVFNQAVATLGGGGGAGPVVDVWHGDGASFGTLGTTQQAVNIVGNAADPDGIDAITYAVNGGAAKLAGIGPNGRRLAAAGDFNIDIDRSGLSVGSNTVVLTAFDDAGNSTSRTVRFDYVDGNRWPHAYGVDWSDVADLSDHVDVVDGHWTVTPDGLRTAEVGYDRVAALGDEFWADYEILVPVTVHSVRQIDPGSPSAAPGVGLLLRWNGHNNTVTPGSQPLQGFLPAAGTKTPFGALAFWRDRTNQGRPSSISLLNHRAVEVDSDETDLDVGEQYYIRARVVGDDYSFKLWKATNAPDMGEPSAWSVKMTAGTGDRQPAGGSIGLLAHEMDVTFGDVAVIPYGVGRVADGPDFTPPAGLIDAGDAIEVQGTGKADGIVHYTLDGSDPTPLSPRAEFGIPITESSTVKAIEYRFGKRPSPITSATYTINGAPDVSAGPDAAIAANDTHALTGTASDDGVGGQLVVTWMKIDGPGNVTFDDPSSAATTVAFSAPGEYTLSLEATDGLITRSDEVTITVRREGYWLADATGRVYAFGEVSLFGDLSAANLSAPVVAMAARPTQDGYWIAGEDGLVRAYGGAPDLGDISALTLDGRIVDMAAAPGGDGYYLLGLDGGVFSFGAAPFFGSTGGLALAKPVRAMGITPSGLGYWFAAEDGGIFSFGDAEFFGSVPGVLPPGVGVDLPIVGMASTPSGRGYWLVAADGGLFAFGDAEFFGSIPGVLAPGTQLAAPIVGMVATATGKGYWLIGGDGGVFAFGDAVFDGSLGGNPPASPVVALAS